MNKKRILVESINDGEYTIVKEERENHPGRYKACLYHGDYKLAACKDDKITLKSHEKIPDECLESLKRQWRKIADEEARADIA